MLKRLFYMLFACIFGMILLSCAAFADEAESADDFEFGEEVDIALPTFDVVFNSRKYDSDNAEYPCIVYKDITYLPMTDAMCGYMGLQMHREYVMSRSYQDINFVFVGNSDITCESLPDSCNNADVHSMKARVYRDTPKTKGAYTNKDGYLVLYYTVVQDYEHNGSEEYPVLYYNDTYYLPLTWDIAYEKLGWEYSFDHDNGLVIDSREAFRPELWVEDVKTWIRGNITRGLVPMYICGHDYYIYHHAGGWMLEVYDRVRGKSGMFLLSGGEVSASFNYLKTPVYSDGILTLRGAAVYGNVGPAVDVIITIDVWGDGAINIVPIDR